MAVKLSSFLNTSFATSAIDSIAVIGIIEAAEATMPLDSGTSGNYLKNLLVDSSLSITGGSVHAATPTIGIDSSFTATLATSQTLSNKTIDFSNNTIRMTLGQLNTAISGGLSVASLTGTEILTNKTLTSPIINTPSIVQGSITDITTFGLRDVTTSAFETRIVSNNASPILTADRILTIDINNANRTLELGGNLSLAGSLTTSGAFATTLTSTGATSVTLPTSGTLVSKDGSGNVNIAGTMTANAFSGDGSGLTGVTSYVKSNFDSDFGTKTTTDLTEGSNLYYTDNRFDIRLATKSTSDLSEGSNLYYTTARAASDAKNAISITDAGGDGSLTYAPSTGVITYTGPSASEVRAHLVAGTGITYNSGTGVFSTTDGDIVHDNLSGFVANEHIDHSSVTLTAGTGLTGGGTIAASRTFNVIGGKGIIANANDIQVDSANIRGMFSASGNLSYNSGTGVFSFSETYSTASQLLTAIKTVDGTTSGLDADLLDGQHGTHYRINVYNNSGTLLN